VKKKK
jgi:dynein heavy chain